MNSPILHLSPQRSPVRSTQSKDIPLLQIDDSAYQKLKASNFLFKKGCLSEAKIQIFLGTPIGFAICTRLIQYFTDQAMVGHLGTEYLAAASLANVLMSFTGSYIFSFCDTINVLCSQANGANNLKLVSEWYQLGCVLSIILSIPAFFVFIYAENILLLFGTQHHIARLAGTFAKWSTLSIIPNVWFMASRMYFKSQSIVLPATFICAIMVLFNLATNFILVYGYGTSLFIDDWDGLGFVGSPIATAITRTVTYLLYIGYMFGWKKYHLPTWSPLNLSTFSWSRTKRFLKVAVPQTISSAMEDWQIQIIALFCASMDDADLAAFNSLITVCLIFHTFAIGIGNACTIRCGNALGANQPNYAKYISIVGICIALLAGGVLGIFFMFFGKYLAIVVSGSHEIFRIYEEICPIVGTALFLLAAFTVICSILVAQARTVGLAIGAIVGCWFVSVPASYMLGIYWNYGIRGIWYGIVAGYIIFALICTTLYLRSDWNQCALEAVKRSTTHPQSDDYNIIDENIQIKDHGKYEHVNITPKTPSLQE